MGIHSAHIFAQRAPSLRAWHHGLRINAATKLSGSVRRAFLVERVQAASTRSQVRRERFDRFIARSPKILRPRLKGIRDSPVSTIVSFLILHELTAVIPLFILAGAFHYYQWLPQSFVDAKVVAVSIEQIAKWFRKKGWIETDEEGTVQQDLLETHPTSSSTERSIASGESPPNLRSIDGSSQITQQKSQWGGHGDKVRWVMELGTAWAAVKVLLIPRLILSAWWAPGFAKLIILPIMRLAKR